MSWRRHVREVARDSFRYVWLFLLFASLLTLAMADNEPAEGHLVTTWLACFAMLFSMGLGITVTDALLAERLVGPRFLTWRGVAYTALVALGWVVLGVEIGALVMRPFAAPELLDFVKPVVRLTSFFGAPMTVAGIRSYEGYQELRMREVEAQRAALAAQVQALQARIQPHFLFNCLNLVASLIEEDPKRAEAAVVKLSDLLRYTLDASKKRLVRLSEELEMVEGFLELETLRHPERLKVVLHADPGLADVPVPPLLLQPIVENAVLHGIGPRREGGRIEIQIRRDGDVLRLHVEDDGPGPGRSGHRGTGTALRDLRERISLLYGEAASLAVGQGSLGGYRVKLCVPLAADGPAPGAAR